MKMYLAMKIIKILITYINIIEMILILFTLGWILIYIIYI